MKRFLVPASLVAALAVAAIWVGTAIAGSHTFTASYKGHVTEVVNGNTVTAKPKGRGTATAIGKGTMTGTVTANTSNPPCTPLSGTGTLKGLKGTLKLKLTNSPGPSRACAAGENDQNNISFSGSAKVTGGSGALRRAKGTLHFTGHYDRGTGAFNVKLTGTLKY